MQYTENYNMNLPEGSDIVNPLTVDNPNWQKIDSEMYSNKAGTVQVAQMALQETTIAITRDKSKPGTFRFISTVNYNPSYTITVDGTTVTATLPDGSALVANSFRIGSNVLCSLNGTALTIYTVPQLDVEDFKNAILQAVYPVGALYMSATNSVSPSTVLGFGSWERVQGRFLLGASDTYAVGSTGGEAEHTLTIDEMPAHNHGINGAADTGNSGHSLVYQEKQYQFLNTASAGGNKAHNNMPPYLSVYIWKRTA